MSRRRPLRFLVGLALIALVAPAAALVEPERAPQPVIDAVVKAVCGKKIVLLGELPSHGEALGFDAKARIVDRLISKCGFSAVLFEAGVYDFVGFDRAVASKAATTQQLDDAIGRFWLTRELAPWRAGLFGAATERRYSVGGLDDQVSITSTYAREALPRLIRRALPNAASADCGDVVTRNLGYTYDAAHPFDEREKLRLQQCARDAAAAAASDTSVDAPDRMMLGSFSRYAGRQRDPASSNRDESMFQNLAWYLDTLPPSTRVVVWTATVHAARQRGVLDTIPLGARVVERWGDRAAAVGFTAYAGFTSRAARPAVPIPAAPADSLEATMTSETAAWAVLDATRLRAIGRIPSRLFGRFQNETWSDYFDLVVVTRTEAAPTFDPWK